MMVEERKIPPPALVAIGLGVAGAVAFGIYTLAKAKPEIPEPPSGLANLYGKVTDAETGAPISGVMITLDSMQVFTDTGGNYIFTDLEPGGYTIQFSKDGYETETY